MSFAMHQLVAAPATMKASRRSQGCQPTSAPPSLRATTQRRHDGALRGPRRSMNLAKVEVEVKVDELEQCNEAVQVKTAAPTKKQSSQVRRTPQRHQSTSRGPRRNIGSAELDELVETSELVPTSEAASMHKQSFDSESVSTTAPPSAESSPVLTIMADAPAWPSLREAWSGFDFCSTCSDEEYLWEDLDLPEPALAMEESQEDKSLAKLSYADSVRRPSASLVHMPPVAGTRTLPPFQHRSCNAPVPGSTTNLVAEDDADVDFRSTHGWTKAHKASRSKKQQRKVADQKERRASQRNESRGCPDIED